MYTCLSLYKGPIAGLANTLPSTTDTRSQNPYFSTRVSSYSATYSSAEWLFSLMSSRLYTLTAMQDSKDHWFDGIAVCQPQAVSAASVGWETTLSKLRLNDAIRDSRMRWLFSSPIPAKSWVISLAIWLRIYKKIVSGDEMRWGFRNARLAFCHRAQERYQKHCASHHSQLRMGSSNAYSWRRPLAWRQGRTC